jgi:hypothetical protein
LPLTRRVSVDRTKSCRDHRIATTTIFSWTTVTRDFGVNIYADSRRYGKSISVSECLYQQQFRTLALSSIFDSAIADSSALIEAGLRAGLINGLDSDIAYAAEKARTDAIQVDAFTLETYQNIGHASTVSKDQPE